MNRFPPRMGVVSAIVLLLGGLGAIPCRGAILDAAALWDLGYTPLQAWLGPEMPTGQSTPVTQVEIRNDVPFVGGPNYFPRLIPAHFAGKTITPKTPMPEESGHATNTSVLFFSHTESISPGIDNVEVWMNTHWLVDGSLRTGLGDAPLPSDNGSRVFAHNWVANLQSVGMEVEALRRVDWRSAEWDELHIVANNTNPPTANLLQSGYNALTGQTIKGTHRIRTNNMGDAVYAANRLLVQVVTPIDTAASDAVPLLASSAALMLEYAAEHPSLSNGQYEAGGRTIHHAGASEVVRATIMAGANRRIVTTFANNATYTVNTPNGLDQRYGAGALNLFHTFQILSAGESDSIEDGGTGADAEAGYGWDYDPSFGGLNSSNAKATYEFTTAPGRNWLAATLAWNIAVTDSTGQSATVYDMALSLTDVTNPSNPVLVASAADGIHNHQTIWRRLGNGRRFELTVEPRAGQEPFEWDYALAWRLVPDFGDFNGDGRITAEDVDLLIAAMGGSDLRFDLTADQAVNNADFAMMIEQALGTVYGDVDLDGMTGIGDLSRLAVNFGSAAGYGGGDVNGDGIVNISDLSVLAVRFGSGGGAGSGGAIGGHVIPEPISAVALICLSASYRPAPSRSKRICNRISLAD